MALPAKKKHTRQGVKVDQAIREYYLEPRRRPELTDKQEEIRQRYLRMNALLLEGHPPSDAVKIHAKENDITNRQAWNDYRGTVALFGQIGKAEKEGMRRLLYEHSMRIYKKASSAGDIKGMNSAINNMWKLLGLDKEDSDLPDFEKLQPSLVVLGLPEHQLDRIEQLLGSGVVDFSGTAPNIEDIQYEELDDEEE